MSNNKAFKVKNGLELSDYNKSISDTAVDIFVYDTRKDSDGGAWRKRTQHTSWYNETLNTATRGSRKEFPAVAVIVAETNQVTIYDGDDPDLPMWMVFEVLSTKAITTTISSVSMLNGTFSVSTTAQGFYFFRFISDYIGRHFTSATYSGTFKAPISGRNTTVGYNFNDGLNAPIVNANINDVAMTVLPNAPIDATTGLPVPTIAVATNGGWSQISDDGNVYDFAFSSNPTVDSIGFTEDKTAVFWTGDSNAWTNGRGYFLYPLLTSDKTSQTYNGHDGLTVLSVASTGNYPQTINSSNTYIAEYNNIGTNLGLVKVTSDLADRESTLKSNNMGAYITSSYNTGWMNGDIKLATLSDTDATNVTGSELVTNGTFDTDISGWTAGNGATLSVSSGELVVTNGSSYGYADQSATLSAGVYTFSADMTGGSVTGRVRIGTSAFGGQIVNGDIKGATSKHIYTFTLTSTTTVHFSVGVQSTTVGAFTKWDNISVRLAEEDRSVNNNGLQVFGTVTKSAVATGADLVGYSGFSTSNYLEQPYNSNLNFGTGDFCVMGWVNVGSNTSHQGLLNRDTLGATGAGLLIEYRYDVAAILFQPRDGSTVANSFTTTGSVGLNRWIFFVGVRDNNGTVQRLYLNGELNQTVSVSALDVDSTTAITRLGREVNQGRNFSGKMALWRISATVPSPEQIKKIYEDEKVLFQENAKAVLYGSSDAVTALAYDDSTNILSVGTSAGRSDFQGLRRVNNTTNAVGAAISASNGLIVEE